MTINVSYYTGLGKAYNLWGNDDTRKEMLYQHCPCPGGPRGSRQQWPLTVVHQYLHCPLAWIIGGAPSSAIVFPVFDSPGVLWTPQRMCFLRSRFIQPVSAVRYLNSHKSGTIGDERQSGVWWRNQCSLNILVLTFKRCQNCVRILRRIYMIGWVKDAC